jgi:hypothetical protein
MVINIKLSQTYPGGSGVVDLPYLNPGIYLVSWQQGESRMTLNAGLVSNIPSFLVIAE